MCSSDLKEEKHYSFNFEKLQPEYIPTVGDVVIVWDDNSKENAVVGVMNEMDKTVRPYKINDGTWYGNCDRSWSGSGTCRITRNS